MANLNRDRQRNAVPQAPPLLAPNWFLGLVPRQYWNVFKRFFTYEQDFLPNAAGATAVGTIQIQADSHFLCIGGLALVTTTDNLTIINSESNANASRKLLLITDGGSGAPISQVPTPLDSLFGTGQRPSIWALPKLFRRGGSIITQIQNLDTVTAHNVRLTYTGVRIYPDLPASD